MFVTFIGSKKSVFVTRSRDEMQKYGFDVRIIDPSERNSVSSNIFCKFYRIFYTLIELSSIKNKKIVFVHTLNSNIVWLAPVLNFLYNKVVLICYGSDVLRNDKKIFYSWAFKFVSIITATNVNVLLDLIKKYNISSNNLSLLRFGLPVFDEIDSLKRSGFDCEKFKEEIGLRADKIIVSLGYNATKGQRVGDLIDFIYMNYENFSHVQFVVPLQYGDALVRDDVMMKCKNYNNEIGYDVFVPITNFYDTKQSAMLRMSTDVLINNSESDAFSGTVQEVLYAGNLILASEVLPYENMPGYSTAIITYKSVSEAMRMLDANFYKRWKSNASNKFISVREELKSVSSWSSVINDWKKLAK